IDITASSELVMGTLFLFQTGIGLLGNVSLLCFYVLTSFTKHTQRPVDLILTHLALANSLFLLCRGIPQILDAFAFKYFMGEVECKVNFYTQRVARGVSLCSTCFLSGFQASMLSLGNSRWAELKRKAPKFIPSCCSLCWVLHLLIHSAVPVKITHSGHTANITKINLGLCSGKGIDSFTLSFHAFLFSFTDILFLGLMIWASGSIVIFLQRHKQRVQYIHRTSLSPRASLETTATHTVLLLVSLFVSFYSVSSAFFIYLTCCVTSSLRLWNINVFLAACFPVFSPFVLITRDIQLFRTYFVSGGKMKTFK
ncbi:vomeronasal type-1 receptor 1-like, partial [Phyllostomus hastatus]|uniref:vomeronasal type-1 receptor 1-like n=1 Tax=Phyllostomus hastatus TaxID=9423 RepID=UPI001E67E5EA